MDGSDQLSILERRNNNFRRKRASVRIAILLLFFLAGFFVFYARGFLKNNFLSEEAPAVMGEMDAKTSPDSSSLLSQYSFPIPFYIPVKKEGISDLQIPNAHSSVVIDVDSGTILHYNDGEEKRQIASLTKIMTAVLVVEIIGDLENEKVVIDEEAVFIEGTKIGCPRSGYCPGTRLRVGETISAKELLKAMLMNSANDAAVALAKHIGGTQEGFVKMMNEKAKEMGLKNSDFCSPSGLEISEDKERCYSSAYDIARIAAYSMKYDEIWDIFKIPSTTIYSFDRKIAHEIMNTNALLEEMPECLGAKTGFTPLAGYSLMLAATDNLKRHRIVAVLLDDPYRWGDAREMVNWAFDSYEWK
jgi:D-alanyl-D-alanine carboxypeptidase